MAWQKSNFYPDQPNPSRREFIVCAKPAQNAEEEHSSHIMPVGTFQTQPTFSERAEIYRGENRGGKACGPSLPFFLHLFSPSAFLHGVICRSVGGCSKALCNRWGSIFHLCVSSSLACFWPNTQYPAKPTLKPLQRLICRRTSLQRETQRLI